MNRIIKYLTIFVLLSFFSFLTSCSQEDFTKYIDPTIGNVAQFLVPTYPTMHLPNQMIRMFPVKQDYLSDQVVAFPFQVTSHRQAGILKMKVSNGELTPAMWNQKMNIDHDLEVYNPWFYSTYLIDDEIRVSFVPGEKCAIYKIDFPGAGNKNLLISGSDDLKCSFDSQGTFAFQEKTGETSKGLNPVKMIITVYVYGELCDNNNDLIKDASVKIQNGKCSVSFLNAAPASVLVRYAVSYISPEQAKINFDKELTNVTFDDLTRSGKKAWGKVINQIKVKGGTEAQKRTFYTSLYRTYERMVNINEGGKYFSGYDNKVHESNRPFFVDDWTWDTYRAQHPLRTILDPQMENDILNSYTLMYEQSGWMPTFPQVHGNHMCMNSYHSSAIFIDGYRKGLKDYPVEKAYEGIKKNLMEGSFIPWRQGTTRRPVDDFLHENGYFPGLYPNEKETDPQVDDFEKRQPVPVTLGISYDFWTLGQLAMELGKTSDFERFSLAGSNYKNLWDPQQKLFMPRDNKGEWIDINPKSDGGKGYREYFDENNGWTYAWDVQHDINGLITLLGGKKAAEERLDQMFREPLGMKKSEFYVDGSNSTGMVGQFSMGNEPSFHIPFLYNYFGAPWKTQRYTRFLLDVWFKDNIFGMPGDEDGGGMTAFVVFTSMGLYPVTPGLPYYNITSPVFEETTINLKNGKTFTILAKGACRKNKYIQKAYLNGLEISKPFITHNQITDGGTLELILGELPNKEWGKDAEVPELQSSLLSKNH